MIFSGSGQATRFFEEMVYDPGIQWHFIFCERQWTIDY